MKRILLESRKALPYTPGQTVDRLGALSAIFGFGVTAADEDAVAAVTVTHSDQETGPFEEVVDEQLFLEQTLLERDDSGKVEAVYTATPVAAGELYNIDIDLLACKQYIRIEVEYTGNVTAACVLVLGDHRKDPPKI